MRDIILIFNPYYHIHHDETRLYITTDKYINVDEKLALDSFHAKVHPMHAMFLSFFMGEESNSNLIPKIAKFFSISEQEVEVKINEFYYNKDIVVEFDKMTFSYPYNLLVEKGSISRITKYNPEEFYIEKSKLNFNQSRFNRPVDFTIVINNLCYTDCAYCYADRKNRRNTSFTLERYKSLISEAKQYGINKIDITGGEIFLYKHWFELLCELAKNDYYSYISTKIPLSEQQIVKLVDIGYKFIQVSLDSSNPNTLSKLVNVENDYYDKMIRSISLLNRYEFDIVIKVVLTNLNSTDSSIKDIIKALNSFENVSKVEFAIMEYSINNEYENFQDLKIDSNEIARITNLINSLNLFYKTKDIYMSGFSELGEYVNSAEEKKEKFEERAVCTGNFNGFFVLPDGNVTLCEELYWREEFYLGNLIENSIFEVWNSKKAMDLFYLKDKFNVYDSLCKDCGEFMDCRINGKGVCWKEVIAAYGEDNYLYPDPRCSFAPSFDKPFAY